MRQAFIFGELHRTTAIEDLFCDYPPVIHQLLLPICKPHWRHIQPIFGSSGCRTNKWITEGRNFAEDVTSRRFRGPYGIRRETIVKTWLRVLKKIEFSVVFVGWSERIGFDTPPQISSDSWRVKRPTGNGCGHSRLRIMQLLQETVPRPLNHLL